MKTRKLIIYLLLPVLFFGCKKDDTSNNNLTSGKLGEVGNTWNVKIADIYNLSTNIIAKKGDVYTLQVSWGKINVTELKFGYTGHEVMDYVYSDGNESQPFTMVKFDAKVGDIYSFNNSGVHHQREVLEKKTYHIPALNKDLETIGVYEWIPVETPSEYFGLTIREIMWYWHPDYGLVCVEFYTDKGDYYEVVFVQIDL